MASDRTCGATAWDESRQEWLWPLEAPNIASFMIFFSFGFLVIGRLMLYRRGRPTSIELLLLMVIPKLSLPLSCHSPLGLHHLLRLVGAARGLVALRRVEVLQVGRRVRTARITAEVADGVRARSGTASDATDIYVFPSVDDQTQAGGPPALHAALNAAAAWASCGQRGG